MGFFREADKVAGDILKDFRGGIIFIGRFLLLATFVEDGFRMWHQWEEHVQYVGKNWSLADDVAYFIILLNLIGQLLGSFFILVRFLVTPAVLSLFILTIGQTVIYTIFYEPKFLLRHMAMMGALMILLAEHQDASSRKKKKDSASPGLPVLTDDTPANCLQLFGRICLILLFCTLLHFWNQSPSDAVQMHDPILEMTGVKKEVIHDAFGFLFIVLVTVGYHTRLSSCILIIWLGVMNFFVNDFWNTTNDLRRYDYQRFDFFQTLTVIGGLNLLLALGPGYFSIDEDKKDF